MIEYLIKKEITHYENNNGEIPVSEEELYLERDEEIAAECICTIGDFELADETYEELLEYGLYEYWNDRHTVCYMLNV